MSVDWILKGEEADHADISPFQQQKSGADFDPDMKEMIEILQMLMLAGDADLRGWTKIQFKNAFKDYLAMLEEEKKLHA